MIEILNQQKRHPINIKKFKALLEKLSEHYGQKGTEVTLVFVNNSVIKELNRKFLNQDAPTDVLSFPIRDHGADGKFYLGDIIISIPKAFQQCSSKKHGLERELELLTIDGFLHLYGLEHSKGFEEEEHKIRKILLREENGH